MLNRIFKTKFDPATGLSYAVSELGKSHNVKSKSLVAASLVAFVVFSGDANAQCAADSDPHVNQVGDTCTYARDSIHGTSVDIAAVDLRSGATATFTAPTITLRKTNDRKMGSSAAIFLRKEDDVNLKNRATFDGNVTVLPSNNLHVKHIVVGGGSELLIKGDVDATLDNYHGVIFALNNASFWMNDRQDTKMVIEGNFTGKTETGSFLDLGNGDFTFSKNVNFVGNNYGEINVYPNTSGKLTFKGETFIQNGKNGIENGNRVLHIDKTSNPTITFNKLIVESNSNRPETFILGGGKTSILGDSNLNVPNAGAVSIYNSATFENGGNLTFTSKDGILVHGVAEEGNTAVFNNLENGVINNEKHIAVNDGVGTLEINNSGKLTATEQELFKNTAAGTITATNTGTLNGFLTSDADTLTLVNETGGVWNNTKDSTLDNLANRSTINFVAPQDKSHLTISTDKYAGGGTLVMNTIWNDDGANLNGTSTTDKLKIKTIEGNAVTTVKVVGNKLGTITPKDKEQFSVDVIEVENAHNGNLFVGTAETNSPQEAQLMKEGNNYRWTLKAKLPDPVVPPTKPADPTSPTVPTPTVDIISKPVVGYVQQPYINRKMGLDQLGKLHERVGEQRNTGWENGNAVNQVWGRMNLDYTALQGRSRFGADVKSGFVQFGRDINFKLNDDKSQQHTGLTFTYGWANSKFFDKYKAENGVVVADKFTGSAKSDMLSIGGYHTYYSPTGAYLDLIGQVSWLQNRYRSGSTQAKQNGYGFGASIEVGKPYHLLNPQVTVEPQAQLSYQSIWLNGFNDGIRQVKKSRQDSLVGRLGVRVNWSETLDKNSPQVYFTANLIQTLAGKGSAITVGREQVKERFGDLAAEFGLGGQYPISQNLSFYADARYVIGIQDRNRVHRDSSLSRRSYHAQIGIRYSW